MYFISLSKILFLDFVLCAQSGTVVHSGDALDMSCDVYLYGFGDSYDFNVAEMYRPSLSWSGKPSGESGIVYNTRTTRSGLPVTLARL